MKKTIAATIIFIIFSLLAKSQTTRYFEFMTSCGGGNWIDTSFVAATSNQVIIDTVLANIARPSNQRKFINGNITSGNGGCNHNASHWFLWHFIPDQWNLVYVAIEFCDGCPSGLDSHPAILAGDTIQFCPWTGIPVREVSNPNEVNEHTFENEISLYPNPANENIRIEIAKGVVIKNIKLHDLNGKLIKTYPSTNTLLNIADISQGKYLLLITTNKGTFTEKIIKQ